MSKSPLIIIQDGAVDEFMSIALAVSFPDVDLVSVVVVNGDCIGQPTVEVTQKLLAKLDQTQTGVYLSDARAVNAFPWAFRESCLICNLLPLLNVNAAGNLLDYSVVKVTQDDLVAQVSKAAADSDEQVTLLVLSPLTPVATALEDPNFKALIKEVVWMGGAYPPSSGNVSPGSAPGSNPNAEWNAYWDPFAVETVFASGLNITMFPLNVTDLVPFGPQWILDNLVPESQQYPIFDLAAQMYATVAFQPGFSFWDTVTTAYLGKPDLFTFQEMKLSIDTSIETSAQGSITIDTVNGYTVNVAQTVDTDDFYNYYLSQLKLLPFQ